MGDRTCVTLSSPVSRSCLLRLHRRVSTSPREIVLARGLSEGPHLLRIEHRSVGENAGCRIEAFHASSQAGGDLLFNVSGEENFFLVDARALLPKDGRITRNDLVRNWLTGQCSLVSLPPVRGYSLEQHGGQPGLHFRRDVESRYALYRQLWKSLILRTRKMVRRSGQHGQFRAGSFGT